MSVAVDWKKGADAPEMVSAMLDLHREAAVYCGSSLVYQLLFSVWQNQGET